MLVGKMDDRKVRNPARARALAREALRRERESRLSIVFSATAIWRARAALRRTRALLPRMPEAGA